VVKDDIESHIDDILNALSGIEKEVTRKEVEKELNRFMEYGVPIDQAKQTLIKKFGGIAVITSSGRTSERTLISDLKSNDRSVNLLCRVISINPKEVSIKGDTRKIFYGIVGDESGTVPFTVWSGEFDFEKGDVVEISNAYTREWQGGIRLNLGDRVKVEKTDKDKLPEIAFEPKKVKVNELHPGIGTVDVVAKIVDVTERKTEVGGVTKKVFSGTLADETGKAQFTSWHDFKFKEGDVLQIIGGYVKSWKGIPQLTFDEKASVKKLDKNKIQKKDLQTSKMPIYSLIEKRGAVDVEIEGTIVEIRPGSGVITRCPECSRSLQNNECTVHGKVNGKLDLRLKLVIDDGTGSVNSVLNKDLSEKILGKTLDECKKIDENELFNEMNKTIFARRVSIRGNALGDEFGTSIIAKEVKLVDIDIKEEAEILYKELETLL
jgi:replication factor A1